MALTGIDGKDGVDASSSAAGGLSDIMAALLEHPASTLAWDRFGINKPPVQGGGKAIVADWFDGFGLKVHTKDIAETSSVSESWYYAIVNN